MVIKSWSLSLFSLSVLICGLICRSRSSFVVGDEGLPNEGVNVLSPLVYKILLERYPQLFDPNYEMEKRYKTYEFGLGKRSQMYSFGLGKRSQNFNLGLGDQFEPYDEKDDGSLELMNNENLDENERKSLIEERVKREIPSSESTDLYLNDEDGDAGIMEDYLPFDSVYSLGTDKSLEENSVETPLYQFALGKLPLSSVNSVLEKRRNLFASDSDSIVEDNGDKRDRNPYAFGLGKRVRSLYGFGLGKRARGMYEFGLGKRDIQSDSSEFEKKDPKIYEFGLGKRSPRIYEFGLGKRSPKMYEFGLGKRLPKMYEFGLGKREPKMYEFGLGKREPKMYEFGLGKREPKMYEFGLGKREPKMYEFGLGKRSPKMYEFGLGKRSPKMYEFGLGKRSPKMYEFGLGKRKPYEFGLGKRKPTMYEFGLGKRGPNVYEFGLGKRDPVLYAFDVDSDEGLGDTPSDRTLERIYDYHTDKNSKQGNHKKSRSLYEFGLGKREAVFEEDLHENKHKNELSSPVALDESIAKENAKVHPKSVSNNVKSLES